MHIGVFSGTFDPIHEGHVLFAQTALEQFGLDKVVLIPEPKPRRKTAVTDIAERQAMVNLAIQNYPQLELLDAFGHDTHDIEDTLPYLQNTFGNADITLLMGADVFEYIEEWPNFDQLREETSIICGLRTEDDGEIVMPLSAKLAIDVEFLPSPLNSVASSKIRSAIAAHEQPKGLDDNVARYIQLHHLYEDQSS